MLTPAEKLRPLYRGTFLFGVACGISIALTPLYLDAQGFDKEQIGSLALLFAAGLVLFALPVGRVLRRFGGPRTLTSMLVGYAVCVAAFPFMPSYGTIAGIRFLDGVFSIGIWVSSETIVLSRADAKHKGHLTSLYAIWLASGYVVGPVLATGLTRWLSHRDLFVIAGLMAITAAAYVARALESAEVASGEAGAGEAPDDGSAGEEPDAPDTGLGALLLRIKTSCFAAFSYGYFQASVVLFLPLYLIESKAIPPDDTIILPGLFCFGMLLFSNAAGRRGDRWGHLKVVTSLSALGTCFVLGFVFVDHYWLMCALVFGAGATFASMSPVALALIGVIVPRGQLSRANSVYNTFYAGGMLIGPPVTSLVFAHYGGAAMLYHLTALWTVFVSFTLLYASDDPAAASARDKALAS